MSNEEFVETLVTRLNAQFDLPAIGEEVEARMLRWLIKKAEPHIPTELREVILSVSDGLDAADLDRFEDWFVDRVNANVDVPFVPEGQEEALIWRPMAQALRGYAEIGLAL